jgi:DTW domain-containing protein
VSILGPRCARCSKPPDACVCDLAAPLAARHRVLILQHPQESRQPLSSAPLIPLAVEGAIVRVGLSWPNLSAALGAPLTGPASAWGVLYLGKKDQAPTGPLGFVNRDGAPIAPTPLTGLVAIDGTWSQARTMWWRNPWLLKLRRLVLAPGRTSRYGDLRLAARTEGLSTLEAVAETLRALGEPPAVPAGLEHLFEQFLARWAAATGGA